MIAYLLFIFYCGINSPSDHLSRVREMVGPVGDTCLLVDTVVQEWFPDICFLQLDTLCYNSTNPRSGDIPFKVALDSSGALYRLFGFDSIQFNDIVTRWPRRISSDSVFDFGRFFIDNCLIYSFAEYSYLTNLNRFIDMNRECVSLAHERFPSEVWNQMQAKIRAQFKGIDLARAVYTTDNRKYSADYYIWFSNSGNLRYIRLAIRLDGMCSVEKDSVVARGLGCFDPIIR